MPITVRVRNFQSIADATVVIDGFTVISGPNNSGKTALMRAIRGVFTNAPAGALVRRGEAYLIVDIDFGDGNTVTWEKGWEKPGQKGGTVNRYTVNGTPLGTVGRGCPDEVLALGINSIQAGTDTVWPQIADQFKGVLFLVGSPGSTMAEAIANVDRVGRLTTALKLSEKERRSVTSKLKVRREDEETLQKEVAAYEGLDAAGDLVDAVEASSTNVSSLHSEVLELREVRERWVETSDEVNRLAGVEDVPGIEEATAQGAVKDGASLMKVKALKKLYDAARGNVAKHEGIEAVVIPDAGDLESLRDELSTLVHLNGRLKTAKATLDTLEGCDVTLPDIRLPHKVQAALSFFRGLRERRDNLKTAITGLEESIEEWEGYRIEAETEVNNLLAELGRCPTCGGSIGDHDHGEAA